MRADRAMRGDRRRFTAAFGVMFLVAAACDRARSPKAHEDAASAEVGTPSAIALSSGSPAANAPPSDPPGFVTFAEEVESVAGLAFVPPNGTMAVASCGDMSTRVWDVASGTVLRRYQRDRLGLFSSVVFSRNGERAWSGVVGGLMEWTIDTGAVVRSLTALPEHSVDSLAIAPDERTVVGLAAGFLWVWSLESGQVARKLELPSALAVGYLNDTTVQWVNDEGELCSLVTTGQEPATCLELEGSSGVASALLAGDRVVGGEHEGHVIVWDRQTGKKLRSWPAHGSLPQVTALSSSGRLITVSDDQTVKLWQLPLGNQLGGRSTPDADYRFGGEVAISSDGRTVLMSPKPGTLARWSVP